MKKPKFASSIRLATNVFVRYTSRQKKQFLLAVSISLISTILDTAIVALLPETIDLALSNKNKYILWPFLSNLLNQLQGQFLFLLVFSSFVLLSFVLKTYSIKINAIYASAITANYLEDFVKSFFSQDIDSIRKISKDKFSSFVQVSFPLLSREILYPLTQFTSSAFLLLALLITAILREGTLFLYFATILGLTYGITSKISNKKLKSIGREIKSKLFLQGLNASHAYIEGSSDLFSVDRNQIHNSICNTDKNIKILQSQTLLFTSLPKFASEASLLITLLITIFISSAHSPNPGFAISSLVSTLFVIFKLLSAIQSTARSFFLINSNQSLLSDVEDHLASFRNSSIPLYLNTLSSRSRVNNPQSFDTKEAPLLSAFDLRINVNSAKNEKIINFQLFKGDIVLLNAPSGSGKTRILYTLCGILHPLSGSIDLPINNFREKFAGSYNFPEETKNIFSASPPLLLLQSNDIKFYGSIQAYLEEKKLLPNLHILMNILSSQLNLNLSIFTSPIASSLPKLLNTPIASLSGGQLQRLLLFTALLQFPNILLLDEVTSNLDSKSEQSVMFELCKYARRRPNSAIIFTSHSKTTHSFATNTILF